MAQDFQQPPSIGTAPAAAESRVDQDPVLLRLHAALKGLDQAIYEALRALDIALGRSPSSAPPAALPYRELGRLKDHLHKVTPGPTETAPRSLGDMALDWDVPDDDKENSESASDSDAS